MNQINSLNPRTDKVVIYQGDDEQALYELGLQIERTEAGGPRLMHESDLRAELIAQRNRLLDEAEDRAVTVILRALGRKKWNQLVDAHPPRPDNENDQRAGVNESTFAEPLVAASIASPALSEPDLADFLDALSSAQFEDLYLRSFALNRMIGPDPKALTFSDSAPSLRDGATSE